MNNTLINQIAYDNVVIRVPKGTTADFGIEIEDGSTGEKYNPISSTKVVFSVKKYKTDSNVLISKILDYDAISESLFQVLQFFPKIHPVYLLDDIILIYV